MFLWFFNKGNRPPPCYLIKVELTYFVIIDLSIEDVFKVNLNGTWVDVRKWAIELISIGRRL